MRAVYTVGGLEGNSSYGDIASCRGRNNDGSRSYGGVNKEVVLATMYTALVKNGVRKVMKVVVIAAVTIWGGSIDTIDRN
ncbi:hypothetical protein Ancab_026751 [Ancistrocladus abbreviatus]